MQSAQFIGAVLREKQALYHCRDIPFVLQLYATAKNDHKIAFITELCPFGDLRVCIKKNGPFSLDAVRYYGACILMALDSMHRKGVIHRDVKPENIMLNEENQPILSDFGCVKLIGSDIKRESVKSDPDFVGTPQFMAPELITIPKSILTLSVEEIFEGPSSGKDDEDGNQNENENEDEEEEKENAEYFNESDGRLKDEYYQCLDIWSFGCLLYQMRTAKMLFNEATEFLVFKEVKMMNFTLDVIEDKDLKDLLNKLLKEKPMERIGADGIDKVMKHSFFANIDWDKLTEQKAPPFNAQK